VPLVGYPQRYGKRGSTLVSTSVVLHGDEKSAGVLRKGTFSPGWPVERVLLASLTKKSPGPHPLSPRLSFQTILASGRCQLTRFGLLPSYVVDGSSPNSPGRAAVGVAV